MNHLPFVAPRSSFISRLRSYWRTSFWTLPLFALALAPDAQAANTAKIVNTTASDLSVGTNYTPTGAPGTTTDVQLAGVYTGGTTFTVNGTTLNIGTLNDLDATQALVITNTSATAGSIALNTAANSTLGSNASDLLYVASGAGLTLQNGTGTLTLTVINSGNFDDAGTLTIAGPVNVATGKTVTFTGGGATTVSGAFTALGSLVAINDAGGSVTLSGTNLYSGGTTLTAGTLNFNNTKAIGSGAFTINGGIIDNTSGAAIANANNFAMTWGGDFTFQGLAGGTHDLNLGTGAVTLSGSNRTVTVNGGTLTIGGTVANAGFSLTKAGVGALSVSNVVSGTGAVAINAGSLILAGANTYTGGTTLAGGTLVYNNSKAISTGTFAINGGALDNTTGFAQTSSGANVMTWGGDFSFLGQIGGAHDLNLGTGAITLATANRTVTVNAGTLSAAGTVADGGFNLIKAGAGTLNLSGVISGSGGITVSGGVLSLGGVNTYTGGTNLNGGVLVSTVAGPALGSSGNITFGGGSLQIATANPAVDYSSRIKNSTSAVSIDFTNRTMTLASAIDSTNTGGLTIFGTNTTAVLSLTANNTYTGATVIRGGTVAINGAAGQLTGTSSITVTGGVLNVGDATTALANRIGTGATLTLGGANGGGGYNSIRTATTGANATVTSLTIAPGASAISQTGNGSVGSLNVTNATGQYVRQAGGILEVNGGGGVVNLTFNTAPTTAGNSFVGSGTSALLVGYVIEGSTWAFNQPASANTLAVSSNDVFTSGTNANVTKADTIAGATATVQSLNFTSATQFALTTSAALTVQSGGILFGGNGTTSGALNGGVINGTGSIQAGSGLDLWIGANSGTSTISVNILDDGTAKGLTKFGVATLLLTGNNSFAGPIYLDNGTLAIGSANGLGLSSSTANLNFLGNTTLQASGTGFSSIRNVVIAGGKTATIDSNGQNIGLSGVISQSGSTAGIADSLGNLTKVGNGTLTLNGSAANTYTGLTTVNAGTLLLDNSNFAAQTNLIDNNSTLVMGSGNLTEKGGATGATSQSFNGTILTTNTGGSITTNNNGGAGTTVNLGTVTHNSGTSLNLDTSAGGTITAGLNGTQGWATLKDASGVGLATVKNGVVSRLTGQTTLITSSNNGNVDYITSGSLTLTPVAGINGVASLTLDGTSATGSLDLGGGTLQVAGHGLLLMGSNAYTILDGQVGSTNTELDVHTMGTGGLTISGTISATNGSLVKDGSDSLTLSGASVYGGVTVVNGGSLNLTGSLGITPTTINSTGIFNLTGTTSGATTVNFGGAFNIGAGGVINNALITLNNGSTFSEDPAGLISGTGGFTMGTGNLGSATLAGANTYTGATTVNGGVLNAGIASVTGTSGAFGNGSAVTMGNVIGTAINLNGFDTSIGSITGGGAAGGNVILGGNTLTIGTNNTSPSAYAGAISGTGALVKVGTGTQALSGNSSYTGGTVIKGGILNPQASTSLGTGTITLGDSTVGNNNSAALAFGNVTVTNAVNVVAGSSGTLTIGSGNFSTGTLTGAVTLANNVTLGAPTGTAGITFTMTGGITGTGNVTLASNNATNGGAIILSGSPVNMTGSITSNGTVSTTSNTINSVIGTNVTGVTQNSTTAALVLGGTNLFTSDTTLQAGTVNLTNSLALQKSTVNLNGGSLTFGTLSVAITSATVGGLAGTGNVTLANQSTIPAAVNLTIGNSNTGTGFNTLNPTLSGNILQSGALAASMTKVGTNTQTLTGNNTWAGLTTLAGGILNAGSANALNSAANSGGVTFAGGTLQYSAATSDYSGKIVNSTSAVSIDTNGNAATFASAVANSNTGGLTKLGAGTLTLGSASNAYIGSNTWTGGTVAFNAAGDLGNSSNTTIFNGGTLDLTANAVTLTSATTITAGSTANYVVDAGANLTLNGIVSQSAASGGLSKTGLGTLTLAAANTFTGATLINAGIVDYADPTAFGANSAITVAAGATARIEDGVDGGTQVLTLSGTGATGATGALEALGFTTYSGSIVLAADATISSDNILLTLNGSRITGSGKTLTLTGAGATEIDSAITTGNGGLVQNGSSTLTLTGANTYTGATTVTNGILQAGVATVANTSGAFGVNSAVTVANTAGAGVDLNGFNTQVGSLAGGGTTGGNVTLGSANLTTGADNTSTTYAGVISNSGSVTKIGSGTWNLTGANTYSGGTTVTGGNLKVNNTLGSATGSGLVDVQSGAILSGGNTALNGGSLVTLGTLSHIPTLQTYAAGVVGRIGGAVTIENGAYLAPGNSVGTITVASLTLNSGAALDYEFNGSANDLTSVSGLLTLNGGSVNLYQEGGTLAFTAPGTYDLLSYGSLAGIGIGGMNVLNPQSGFTYSFINDNADNLIQLQIIAAVPEPGTWAMILGGFAVLLVVQARRRNS